MEVDSKLHPFLSYVLSLRPLRQPLMLSSKPSFSNAIKVDLEANEHHGEALLKEMPMLQKPELVAKMTAAVSDVVQTRSVLQSLGERPDYEAVDKARRCVAEIERGLSRRLEEIFVVKTPEGSEWRTLQMQKEKEARVAADKAKLPHKTVVQLYDMHVAYADLLQEAEERLVTIYRAAESGSETVDWTDDGDGDDEMDEEVVRILLEASQKHIDRVKLTGRRLRLFPEGFCKITTLVSVYLSDNKIQVGVKPRQVISLDFQLDKPVLFFDGAAALGHCAAGGVIFLNQDHFYTFKLKCGRGSNMKEELMALWMIIKVANIFGLVDAKYLVILVSLSNGLWGNTNYR